MSGFCGFGLDLNPASIQIEPNLIF